MIRESQMENVMRIAIFACLLVCAFSISVLAGPEHGLVAHWDFAEGKGPLLHDRSGNNHHGTIRNAKWVRRDRRHALRFDGDADYVDCGTALNRKLTKDITIMAWVKLEADPCPNRRTNWAIVDCEMYKKSGFLSRIDGASRRFYFRVNQAGACQGATVRRVVMENHTFYHVAITRKGDVATLYVDAAPCESAKIEDFVCATTPFKISAKVQSFQGLIDDVRIYNRALNRTEIASLYKAGGEVHGHDTAWIGSFQLKPFFYPDEGKIVLEVGFAGIFPEEGDEIVLEVGAPNRKAARTINMKPIPGTGMREYSFRLSKFAPGSYEFRAILRNAAGIRTTERVPFRVPLAPLPQVVSPDRRMVGPLPPPVTPPRYQFKLAGGGGFTVTVKGKTYRVESSYSYPHGGENRLVASARGKKGEPSWRVEKKKEGDRTCRVTASGKYYAVSRRIELQPTRILVKDTIRNKWDQVVGIILSNHINLRGLKGVAVTRKYNPAIFVGRKLSGMGLIALDDLYQLQQNTAYSTRSGLAEIRDEHFGLDKGASYTLEWAVYPTATNDYYDFINQVRKDEGLNRRVEGSFAFIRYKPPTPETVEIKNLKYVSMGCLSRPLDDPSMGLEGIEFVNYPKESERLKKLFTEIKRRYPYMKAGFHVAHGLYVTNRPKEIFPDSRVLKADGKQIAYAGADNIPYYKKRFRGKRVEEGYRWFIFYPTEENSFGKAMIKAMDFMLNEMGATAMWADGYFSGYARGGYSYDRWDGHSVTIDRNTKLVTRKKTCVPYVSIPVLKKVAQMIGEKGGVLVTNGLAGPRSFWKEKCLITSCETNAMDGRTTSALHLGRSVTPLTASFGASRTPRDTYRDMLRKLDSGALIFWYGAPMDHKNLVTHMYPITFESIHAGIVRGKERIITKKSGVYGWHGDRSLHMVYLYDSRGFPARSNFATTVDDTNVRTELTLAKEESAALVKVPITLASPKPVNVNLRQYDGKAIRIALNGRGEITVRVETGNFPVKPGAAYKVTTERTRRITAGKDGTLSIPLTLDGPATLKIGKDR